MTVYKYMGNRVSNMVKRKYKTQVSRGHFWLYELGIRDSCSCCCSYLFAVVHTLQRPTVVNTLQLNSKIVKVMLFSFSHCFTHFSFNDQHTISEPCNQITKTKNWPSSTLLFYYMLDNKPTRFWLFSHIWKIFVRKKKL